MTARGYLLAGLVLLAVGGVWAAARSPYGAPVPSGDDAAITQGTMYANWGTAPGANAGGVGRQTPTVADPRNGGGAGVNPSAFRHARIAFATVWPHATPLATEALAV